MKICTMDQGHMTKMATMPIYIVEKVIFIVAGSCANNLQSLKESHAWTDLDPPPHPFLFEYSVYPKTSTSQERNFKNPLLRTERSMTSSQANNILFSGLKG